MSAAEDLKSVLRLSKAIQGMPMNRLPEEESSSGRNLSLTEDDLDAIADRVVTRTRAVLIAETGRIVWEGLRKLVITGIVALFAMDQLKGWLR